MNPPIFVSATSSDLGAARDLVVNVLAGMGYHTRVQPTLPFVGGDLRAELRRLIDQCGMVIQLVGFRCGRGPDRDDPDFGRVSHTQYEALYAEKQRIRVLYVILPEGYPFASCKPETPELVELQRQYRAKLGALPDQRGTAANPDALQALVLKMRDDLSLLLHLAARQHEELLRRFDDLKADLSAQHRQASDFSQLDQLLRASDLRQLVAHKESISGAPCEPLTRELPLTPILDADNPDVLVHGPPYVGKTCWAFKWAWGWMNEKSDRAALYLNAARDKPSDIARLAERIPEPCAVLLVVDDMHLATAGCAAWALQIAQVRRSRASETRVLWISRNAACAPALTIDGCRPVARAFPVLALALLYLDRMPAFLGRGERLLAALGADLDPALAAVFTTIERCDEGAEKRFEHILSEIERLSDSQLEARRKKFADEHECAGAYSAMLPSATLQWGVPIRFYKQTMRVPGFERGIARLESDGTAFRRRNDKSHPSPEDDLVGLNEHPVVAGRLLRTGRFPPPSDVFRKYLLEARGGMDGVALLERADWTGVPLALLESIRAWLAANKTEGYSCLTLGGVGTYHKLLRTQIPYLKPTAAETVLADCARFWQQQWETLEACGDSGAGEFRRDHVLYEQAYLDYLKGDLEVAESRLVQSVDEALKCMARDQEETEGSPVAQRCFANVWVSAGVALRIRALRSEISSPCSPGVSGGIMVPEEIAQQTTRLYRALRDANACTDERKRAALYESALGLLPRFADLPPGTRVEKLLRAVFANPGAIQMLGRHEGNLHSIALETACWRVLFGQSTCLAANCDAVPSPDDQPLTYRWTRYEWAYAYQLYCHTLGRWASGTRDAAIARDAAAALALYKASGWFEDLGFYGLLACRAAIQEGDRELAQAVCWYLLKRCVGIHRMGGNSVLMLRLRTLSETEKFEPA